MRLPILILGATLFCTQYTAELMTIHNPDGTTQQIVVEKIERGKLMIDKETEEVRFLTVKKN